jgi:hypothetical protein
MRRAGLTGVVLSCGLLVSSAPASAEPPTAHPEGRATSTSAVVLPIRFVSQLGEPAPAWWLGPETPYCVAAASAMVIDALGLALPARPLSTLFDLGHAANVTNDPGIDPVGAVVVLDRFARGGGIEDPRDQGTALSVLTARIAAGTPVIALTRGGTHAVVVYGFERGPQGEIAWLYAADPLTGWVGPVSARRWLEEREWWGQAFAAPGPRWKGRYVMIVAWPLPRRVEGGDVLTA